MFSKIGIVLQGIPHSTEQLKDVYDYYTSLGLNVVVSSYSKYLKHTNFQFVNNDYILGNYDVKTPGKYGNGSFRNVNYQILTTKNGVLYFDNRDDLEYILKIRSDLKINKMDYHLERWCHLVNESMPKNTLKKKILSLCRLTKDEMHPWYITDYFYFGTKHDMKIFWDIPTVPFNHELKRSEEYLSTAFLGGWKSITSDMKAEDYYIFDSESSEDIFSYKWKKNLKFVTDKCKI